MKRSARASLLIAALVFSFLLLSAGPLKAQDAVIKLRYSNFFPPTHANSMLSEEWCREIEKRTNGRVKITYFAGSTLTPPTQTYDSVVKGIADIGQSVLAYSTGRFPLSEIFDYPLGYTSGLQATRLINEYYRKFKPAEFNDTHILYMHGHGPGFFNIKKETSNFDDVKGLRIKSTGTSAEIVKSVGATPVAMPLPETYDSLSKGILDGVLLPIEAMKGWKFGELLKTTFKNYGAAYTMGQFVTMNKQKWDSLPDDIKKVFEEVSAEWVDKQGKQWDALDREAEEYLAKMEGYKIVTVPPEVEAATREKVKPMLDDYVQKMKAKGLPGDEVLKFCLDYIASHP